MSNIPRYGQHPMVEITDVLHAGVVYLGKYIQGAIKEEDLVKKLDVDKKLVVKVIYSGMAFERYGREVHKYLAEKDMAPKYFFSFVMEGVDLPSEAKAIEDHHLMEYLSPPSKDSPGWISLDDLEKEFPKVALRYKEDIKSALYNVIEVLQQAKFVHGDLRPNNLLVSIDIADDCIVQFRQDSSSSRRLPYLKVIDFDWAGIAGEVEYPPHRNPDVEWPGENGKVILDTHDKIMIDSWLAKWPHINVPDAEVGNRRGDEVTYPRIRISM